MLYRSKKSLGFTLIELLVSISIVSVILTVVVLNQSTYTDGAALTNLADEISSTISQAQAYGIGVREVSTGSSEFNASYGVTMSLLGSGSNTAYIYFSDLNGDKIYTGNWSCDTAECLSRVIITRSNVIADICVINTFCSDQFNSAERADVSFARPSTEAQIKLFNNGGQPLNESNLKGIRIELKSTRGLTRSVTVYTTGQISTQ